jgi:hypothetical protein
MVAFASCIADCRDCGDGVATARQRHRLNHRLSINRPTKRGKEKSPSGGHFNAKKRATIYRRVHKFLKESHIVTRPAKKRASSLNINDISFFGMPDCHHCCSIA